MSEPLKWTENMGEEMDIDIQTMKTIATPMDLYLTTVAFAYLAARQRGVDEIQGLQVENIARERTIAEQDKRIAELEKRCENRLRLIQRLDTEVAELKAEVKELRERLR